MSAGKVYDLEYKIQAVKLANEISPAKYCNRARYPQKYRIYPN